MRKKGTETRDKKVISAAEIIKEILLTIKEIRDISSVTKIMKRKFKRLLRDSNVIIKEFVDFSNELKNLKDAFKRGGSNANN